MSGQEPSRPVRPSVSVVVVTAGRRQCLPDCVASVRGQTYRPVELVVVVGPSRDGSLDYVSGLTDAKVTRVDRLNVSVARNAGVQLAAGEIVAFIDDDAVASPSWLEELVRVFVAEGPTCGGVGGLVVNENDPRRPVQAMNNTITAEGDPVDWHTAPSGFNDPDGDAFTFFMGANMAFRRAAIVAAGGFDETYRYPFEDADLSVAVIKAGYQLFHHPRAVVHHRPAPSHNRRGAHDPGFYAFARHQMYFALKFSRRPVPACMRSVIALTGERVAGIVRLARRREISRREAARHLGNTIRGLASGLRAGLRYRRHGQGLALAPDEPRPEFRPLGMDPPPPAPRRRSRTALRLGLICAEFGGPVYGGGGSHTTHLAEALAARGHDVCVFRARRGPCRVRPDGYRVVDVPTDPDPAGERHEFLRALHRESDRRELDLVEAPLWGGHGAAVGPSGRWPLVVRLQTPSAVIRDLTGGRYSRGVESLIAAEQLQLAYAAGVIGISEAVVGTVVSAYGIPLPYHGRRLAVIPLGLPPACRIPYRPIETPGAAAVRFLYVGRLERRKGVLELAEAFAAEARHDPRAVLWLVGADNSSGDGHLESTGTTYADSMRAYWPADVSDRVHFLGDLDDAAKNHLVSACDVLVAPSLYESFGLVFVEAMRAGKPVIGTRAGGIPEVVAEGETGLLVPPGDAGALAEAMLRLATDPGLRRSLGTRGLSRYERLFDLSDFGRRSEDFYRAVLEEWHGSRGRSFGSREPATPRNRSREAAA